MNIKVFQNRKIEKDYFYNEGTQNENNSTVLTFEVPLGYEDFSKRIVFMTEDGNFWDYIPENKYEIKNNITKYGKVEAYLWLTKDDQDFRSQNFELNFYENENADDLVPTEEEIDGFKTLVAELDLKIAEVEALKVEIGDFQEALNSKASKKELKEVDDKFDNYYPKNETYNKTEIDNKISVIPKFNRIVVDELPTENIQEDAIYLVPNQGDTNDLYREYIYIDNKWELIGIQKGDLSNIYTKQEVDEMVKEIQETNEYQSEIIDQFKNEFKQITVSGDSIYIPDAAELPMELVPYGEPVQEVIEAERGITIEGESVVISDGDVDKEVKATVNGNSYQETTEGYNLLNPANLLLFNANKYIQTKTRIDVMPNTEYSIVSNKSFTDISVNAYSDDTNNEKLTTTSIIKGNKRYYTFTTKANTKTLFFYAGQDTEYATLEEFIETLEMMLIKGTEEKPYEPYTGGQASPNPNYKSDIEVIDGVNRFNPKNTTNVFIQNDGSETPNNYAMCTDYIEVKGDVVSIGSNLNWFDVIAFYDKDKNIISRTIVSNGNTLDIIDFRTFKREIPSNAKYVRYFCGNKATEAMLAFGNYDKYIPYGHIGLIQRGKNIFVPTYKVDDININVINSNLNLTEDEYQFTATGKDMYFGQITSKGNGYANSRGTLYNVKGKSKIHLLLTNSEFVSNYITAYDSNKISLGFSSISYRGSYDIPEGAEYITLRIGYSNATVGEIYKTKIMLSFEEITDYEKYKEPITKSIDLQGNKLAKIGDVKDLLKIARNGSVKIGDKVIKEYVFTGDEDITINSITNNVARFNIGNIFLDKIDSFFGIYCNYLKNENTNKVNTIRSGIGEFVKICVIYIDTSIASTPEKMKAWLKEKYNAGEPMKVLYQLAKPTTIDLPSIEPITLFEGTNVFELITNLGTTMEVTYNYVTPSPSIDRPSEILTVEGSYSTELQNEYATITNTLPLTLTNELLGEIVTLTEEEAKELNLDGAGKYRRTDWIRVNGKDLTWFMNNSPIQNKITNRFVAGFANNVGDANIVSAYCNILKRKTPNQIWNEDEMAIGQTKSEITIRVPIELTTNADVRAFFEKNNGYILLKQNPVYEKITDETELQQLSAYDKQVAFFGVNNINTYPTDDLVKAPLKIHATYSKSNKLTIQSLEDRLASLESQVTNLQDNQI